MTLLKRATSAWWQLSMRRSSVCREAEVAVNNTRIIAPFDGTVLKKNADVGEIVAPLGRRGQFEGRGGDHRRYVVAGSRRRRFRSEYHAGDSRARLRNHLGRLSAAALSRLCYENSSHRGSRQGDGAGENQVPRVRPKGVAGDERENFVSRCRRDSASAAESKALLTVPAAAVATRDGASGGLSDPATIAPSKCR